MIAQSLGVTGVFCLLPVQEGQRSWRWIDATALPAELTHPCRAAWNWE